MIFKHFKIRPSFLGNFSRRTKILIIVCSMFPLLIIISQLYLIAIYKKILPANITFINIIGIFSYFLIIIFMIVNLLKLEKTSRDLEEAKLYNKTLGILHDSLRAFKHDFHNIVHAIGGYANSGDINGLKTYYSQLLEDCSRVNNLTSLNPDVVNNPGIYNVLATKYYKADELGIKINLDIFLDLNEIDKNMKVYEFTRVLGILLDNAIEAANECNEKIINLAMRKEEPSHRIVLVIENTYINKDVNTDKIFQKGYSTKEGNTGLGLWEVKQILNRNNNLSLFTTKNEEYFKQQFEIYY